MQARGSCDRAVRLNRTVYCHKELWIFISAPCSHDDAVSDRQPWDEAAIWVNTSGYDRGWVFDMTPLAWLPTAKAVMVGLNPGGPDGSRALPPSTATKSR